MNTISIVRVTAREILDSRGNPTVEAEVFLSGGAHGRAGVPSGASTGTFEATEKRDGQKDRYGGRGVGQAVQAVCGILNDAVYGADASDTRRIDALLTAADGTAQLSRCGANAVLGVSLAAARAAANALHLPFYRFVGGAQADLLPTPMMNVLNGGAHAANTLDVQEFMIMPVGLPNFREALRASSEVYHALGALLRGRGMATGVGDEGGFAPDLEDEDEAVCLLLEAIENAGYRAGEDFVLALDAATSEWNTAQTGVYYLPKSGKRRTAAELAAHWKKFCREYPIASIEDPLGEEDWEAWRQLTADCGENVQLVGDDLFVTNAQRITRGIIHGCANAVLIKPNQIGTLTGTIDAVRTAQRAGYRTILSHRSGETADTSIADLAVALGAGQIKAGAPCRMERVEKYNRLLRIEEELGGHGVYAGALALKMRG